MATTQRQFRLYTCGPIVFVFGFSIGVMVCLLVCRHVLVPRPPPVPYGREITSRDARQLLEHATPFFETLAVLLTDWRGDETITASPNTKHDILMLLPESRTVYDLPGSLAMAAFQEEDATVRGLCVVRLEELVNSLDSAIQIVERQLHSEEDHFVRERKEQLLRVWRYPKNTHDTSASRTDSNHYQDLLGS